MMMAIIKTMFPDDTRQCRASGRSSLAVWRRQGKAGVRLWSPTSSCKGGKTLMQLHEPFLKGVSLHHPTLCEQGSSIHNQVASHAERGHRTVGGKVYGEVLGPSRDGSNDRTEGNPKGNRGRRSGLSAEVV